MWNVLIYPQLSGWLQLGWSISCACVVLIQRRRERVRKMRATVNENFIQTLNLDAFHAPSAWVLCESNIFFCITWCGRNRKNREIIRTAACIYTSSLMSCHFFVFFALLLCAASQTSGCWTDAAAHSSNFPFVAEASHSLGRLERLFDAHNATTNKFDDDEPASDIYTTLVRSLCWNQT